MRRVRRSCRVSVSLTEHEKDALEGLAEKSGLSLSRVIQEAVSEFIVARRGKKVDVIGKSSPRKSSRK